MLRRFAFLIAITTVLLLIPTVHAQDTALQTGDCDTADIIANIQKLAAALDPSADDFSTQLQDVQTLAATSRLECAGMVLSGDNEAGKETVVLGPFDLPENTYHLVMTTDDYIYLSSEEVSGDCRLISFLLDAGDASNGAEDTVKFRGDCRLVFTVKAEGPWTLLIEPLS